MTVSVADLIIRIPGFQAFFEDQWQQEHKTAEPLACKIEHKFLKLIKILKHMNQ